MITFKILNKNFLRSFAKYLTILQSISQQLLTLIQSFIPLNPLNNSIVNPTKFTMVLWVWKDKRGLWEKLLINQFIPKNCLNSLYNANFSTSSFSIWIFDYSQEIIRKNKQATLRRKIFIILLFLLHQRLINIGSFFP